MNALESIDVRAYAGSRGGEAPRAVQLHGSWRDVVAIRRRWRDPAGAWFEVLVEGGAVLTLLCREPDHAWWRRGDPGEAPD